MNRAHGQIRSSQVITSYGPGALIDLPHDSAIVGGLDTWPRTGDLEEIHEPRLERKVRNLTDATAPRLYAPPPESTDPSQPVRGIGALRFPEWFVVQEGGGDGDKREQSRRLVHRKGLDSRRRFDGHEVVATRFVRACPNGHVDDLDWWYFVHEGSLPCKGQLWLDERSTGGDLGDLVVRCGCGKWRRLSEATQLENNPLGSCQGARPWLGRNANEACGQPSRLLIRTASNAWFPQVVSVLSLPDRGSDVEQVVRDHWDDLSIVEDAGDLRVVKRKQKISEALAAFDDEEVLQAIGEIRTGNSEERPVKQVELEAILAAPEGYGDDIPVDPNFHARRLPEHLWRNSGFSAGIAAVFQLHRLREVRALTGFSRFEAVMPDIDGEYDTDVELAQLAVEPEWFPAAENRGEGIFLQLCPRAMRSWLARAAVLERLQQLESGHQFWMEERQSKRSFPGGPYVLLHTLSHLLIQSLAMRCGYPASSIRERVYVGGGGESFGLLLYTASPDAEGTLGGLVQQGRHIEDHLFQALRMSELCSNDPICAHHAPGGSIEGRLLHGAACHGCALVAETSCEMRNDYLDRALVVPVMGVPGAAFFEPPG